jgi:glycosyltransferase involved in cell wall biosynthesis
MEDIFIYPFVLLGRLFAAIKPLKQEYNVFFFFPFYHTGGAEKVHSLVAQAVGNSNCIIFFTRKSVDDTFKKEFEKTGFTIKDISAYTDNKFLYFFNLIYRGIITGYINKQQSKPVVFNGQCNFAYKISPWINKDIKQVELIHSFNTFSWIRLPFLPFIYKTVMISKVRIGNHLDQYNNLQVPPMFNFRITYICNGIELPETVAAKDFEVPLQVLYVGRGTPEKRVHLVAQIAERTKQTNPQTIFTIAGDVGNAIPENLKQYCILKGNVNDPKQLEALYQQSHILLITSETEGFPMVVMEAMSYGCAIVATAVGDLPVHVRNELNGFVTTEIMDEKKVVDEMVEQLQTLSSNRTLLKEIYSNNVAYAKANFDIEMFNKKYQQLLNTP